MASIAKRVHFFEAFSEEQTLLRAHMPDDWEATYSPETIQESGTADAPAPIISVRTQSAIPEAWADSLAAILTRSTGYDHLLAYRQRCGHGDRLAMGHLPEYCSRAVAEQACLLWMALLRRLPAQQRKFHAFSRDGLTGGEAEGRVVAIFGVGSIGYQIADIARGLRMRVIGVDPVRNYEDIPYEKPSEAMAQAEVIVCAMSLTEENRGYFSKDLLARARRGTVFVNVSRGELSPAEDLQAALAAGQLSGVGLDVFEDEAALGPALRSGTGDSPEIAAVRALAARDDCILTPHNAFNTREAVARKAEQSVQQIMAFQQDGRFIWQV